MTLPRLSIVLDHSCSHVCCTNHRNLDRPNSIHPLVHGTRREVSFQHHPDTTPTVCADIRAVRVRIALVAQRENSMAPPPPPLSVPPRPCDHNLVMFQLRSPDSNPLDIWESQFIAFSVLRILLTRLVYMVNC